MRFTLPKTLIALAVATTGALAAAPPAQAQAWRIRNDWTDKVRPNDPDSPTYAESYPDFVRGAAPEWEAAGTRLDCADFSISLLIAYGERQGLPVSFRYWNAATARFVSTPSSQARFRSRADYDRFVREAVNAQNLTVNTRAVQYDEWASGDMVLMNWNQTAEEPNFPGRDVWHTFLIGTPGQTVYYGNLDDRNQPLPIVSSSEPRRIYQITEHGDRFGRSPRRYTSLVWRAGWNVPETAIVPKNERGWVSAGTAVNVRRGPGTGRAVFATAARGTEVRVTARYRDWLRVTLPSGQQGWMSGVYVSAAPIAQPTQTWGVVNVGTLNVRTGPGITFRVGRTVARGARLQVVGREGEWFKVVLPGGTAAQARYVSAAYVTVQQ